MTTRSTNKQTHVSEGRTQLVWRRRADGKIQRYYVANVYVSHTGWVYQNLYGLPGETPEQRAFRRFPISREPIPDDNPSS